MAAKKSRLADAEKLLIHEFQNCVHKINMELDLAELGLVEDFKVYAGLTSAVDLMNLSLEDLRVRLVRMEASHRGRWRASMDKAKARQKIRDNLDSGDLPRDFDLTLESFLIGHPRVNTCAGCREPFSRDDIFKYRSHWIWKKILVSSRLRKTLAGRAASPMTGKFGSGALAASR